jgi:signal transduction histidine kinase
VRFAGPRTAISDSTAHGVLNAVRELVSNAVRHGEAAKIRIAGEVRSGTLRVSVRDDGCGFDPANRPGQAEGHFGLDGIAERIERLGGTFEIKSAPGKGTKATIQI